MTRALAVLCVLCVLLVSGRSAALPGFFVGKTPAKRVAHEAHVVVLRNGDASVVTVMTDYDGPLDTFALVLAVPDDVTLQRVKTLKREFVDRIDQISAPRFHEWWELDPCEPGEAEQEWERSLQAQEGSDFLGGGGAAPPNAPKAAKELFLKVETDFKAGEYRFSLIPKSQPLERALKARGFVLPSGASAAAERVAAQGFQFLVAEVDQKRVELVAGNRAQLSPIRFSTKRPFESLPVRLGLLSAPEMQELTLYVLHPEKRYEAKNYPNVFPPTNLSVEFVVKERVGEFYAALHDLLLAKNAEGVLNEFAWHSAGCGEPCPNAPLHPFELLSLGGDVFEADVPRAEREPEPPPLTHEEKLLQKSVLDGLPPEERPARKKQLAEERRTVLRNKGILARQRYIISRLHHRYDASGLPQDLEITPAASAVRGGVGVPKGAGGQISSEVVPASENRLQMRYHFLHPWKGQQQCDKPVKWRWGKPPRTYRGLRKVWVAEDLSHKNRSQIKPAQVIRTAVPALGLVGQPATGSSAADAAAPTTDAVPATSPAPAKESCGCRVPGSAPAGSAAGLLASLALVAAFWRRRQSA